MTAQLASYARAALYALLFACAATLLGLTAYQVHYTERLTPGGVDFYVPIVVELLATSCFAIIISLWFFIAIMFRLVGRQNSFAIEGALLSIIWIMFLVGAAIITRRWPNLLWCLGSQEVCRVLDAVVAFSWICWVFTTVLMFVSCRSMVSKGPTEPAHGRQTIQTANTQVTNIA